jgi:hypothetical protein
MNLIEKAEHLPKLDGLGASDQSVIGPINKAIDSVLRGLPEEKQIELMDHLIEGGFSFELQ